MQNWLLMILIGVLAIILGIVAFIYPQATGVGAVLFAGWVLIILGIVTIIAAIMGDTYASTGWAIAVGVLMLLLGIVLVRNPLASVATVSVIAGILIIVSGVTNIAAAFNTIFSRARWWLVLSGVLNFILAILIFQMKESSLGILISAQLIVSGITLIIMGSEIKRISDDVFSSK